MKKWVLAIFILLVFLVVVAVAVLVYYNSSTRPFLRIYANEGTFQGITPEGDALIFSKKSKDIMNKSCSLYIKKVPTGEETVVASLEDCGDPFTQTMQLTQDKN